MDPATILALTGAAGSLFSTGASIFGANNAANAQQGIAAQQAAMAQRQLEVSMLMNFMQMNRQDAQLAYQRQFGERAYNENQQRSDRAYGDQQRYNERAYSDSRTAAMEAIARAERDRTYAINNNEELNRFARKQYDDSVTASHTGRTDSAGNTVSYDPVTNSWKTQVNPAIKALMDATTRIEHDAAVKGSYRREQGQEENFKRRGKVGNVANTMLDEYTHGVGAPSYEGMQGADTIARVTRAGAGRDSLTSAVARDLVRRGGSSAAGDLALRGIDTAANNNVRVAIADAQNDAPENWRKAYSSWASDLLNRRSPLAAEASNITDAPFASAQTTTSADGIGNNNRANPNATYGAGAGGVAYAGNQGAAAYKSLVDASRAMSTGGYNPTSAPNLSVPGYSAYGLDSGYNNLFKAVGGQPTQQAPWGSAIGAVTSNIQELIRAFSRHNQTPWNEDSRNDAAYNSWRF